MINDITYYGDGYNYNNTLTLADLGPQYAQVLFQVDGNVHNPNYTSKNGDAAFYAPGTTIYSLKGYKPEFRLALYEDGRVIIFEAGNNPGATKGADLMDLKDKVESISINSETDGQTVLAVISEESEVDKIVEMTLDADLREISAQPQGKRYFIAYHLTDGTEVTRSYWLESGLMTPNIFLPQEFADMILDALNE